jgi:hypothetical protein
VFKLNHLESYKKDINNIKDIIDNSNIKADEILNTQIDVIKKRFENIEEIINDNLKIITLKSEKIEEYSKQIDSKMEINKENYNNILEEIKKVDSDNCINLMTLDKKLKSNKFFILSNMLINASLLGFIIYFLLNNTL